VDRILDTKNPPKWSVMPAVPVNTTRSVNIFSNVQIQECYHLSCLLGVIDRHRCISPIISPLSPSPSFTSHFARQLDRRTQFPRGLPTEA